MEATADGASASVLLLAAVIGYLVGSVPFGLILTRLGGAGDIRAIGSGNIGATNVLRTGRKGLALATLLFDLVKGLLPTLILGHWLGPTAGLVAGGAAVLGHCFPVWLGFKGGKGVATAAGVILAAAPLVMLIALIGFAAVAAATRLVSAASLTAAVLAPLAGLVLGLGDTVWLLLLLALVIIVQHRENIGRLLRGEENKLSFSGKAGPPAH